MSDWDDFKTEGWKGLDLLPLMKRLEVRQLTDLGAEALFR